ncbi:hypothetical protein V6Z11_D11G303200 [Gossypium hirsutum]
MESLPFQCLVDVLMDFESRHMRVVREVLVYSHLVEPPFVAMMVDSVPHDVRGERATVGSHGRGFRLRVQCQIYNRFGHLVQRYFYCFYRTYNGPNASTMARVSSSAYNVQGLQGGGFSACSGSFGGSEFESNFWRGCT